MLTCSDCGHENPDGAKFCMECAAPLGTAPARHTAEERKVVTALFCDLVGSTALAEANDPEALGPILARYFSEMRAAAEAHGGRVEKFIGDAVVALFGLPRAHEDDGLRAVRAGLEMQARLGDLRAAGPMPLEARIGIATGEVLVPADDGMIVGDAMNTAARLQAAATPGHVWIGEVTWRLVRDRVLAEPIPPLSLKGKAEPVAAWRVASVDAPPAHPADTPFVGRERHLRLLRDALADAVAARAGVLVTVLAPPGTGKSRLADTFAAEAKGEVTVLVGQTPSYGEGVTFAPLVELLGAAAGRPGGDADAIAAELREIVRAQPDGGPVGDRLAQSLGVGESPGAETTWAVRRLFEVLATTQPLVVVLEDLHWAEPPMLDLIDSVVERVHGAVLFLVLARPELIEQRTTWAAGKAHAVTTTLPPLSPEETRRVGAALLGDAPPTVIDQVCSVADGNPLYLGQLTAMLADRGLLVDGSWVGGPEATLEIPATMQALLTARLDRLAPAPRRVLEIASVEGRRFRIAALRALATDLSSADVEEAIDLLERGGLVRPEDETAGRWRFVHALVYEATYRGLSKGKRSELHARLAGWLADADAGQADVDELVARHLERALHLREEVGKRDEETEALARRAGALFAAAGNRAFAAFDFLTARDLLGRAAQLLGEDDPARLELLPRLGVALTETGREQEADELLKAALPAEDADPGRNGLRIRVQLLANRVYRSPTVKQIEAAIEELEPVVDQLEARGDEAGVAQAVVALEYLEFARGCCARSLAWALEAVRRGLRSGGFREATQGASDVTGMAVFGPMPFSRFPSFADAELSDLGSPVADAAAHMLRATGALASGDLDAFGAHEGDWQEAIDRNGLVWLGAAQGLALSDIESRTGSPERAERRLRDMRDVLAGLGDIWWVSTLDIVLCNALWAQDRTQEFLRLADSMEASGGFGDRQSLIQRAANRSRALALRGAAVEAESAARRAVALGSDTDLLLDRADAASALAEALMARGLTDEATTARDEAAALIGQKELVI